MDNQKQIVRPDQYQDARARLLQQEKAATRLLQELAVSRRELPMGCVGCSFCMDHIPDLGHLWSRDTSFAAVALAPLPEITAYKDRMGWKFPFYSSAKTHQSWTEAEAQGEVITWKPGNGYFGLCSFIREGDEVFHTYDTSSRGLEILLSTYHLLDMTPMGRQEVGNGMNDFRRHDEY
ncbi:uncharacterized protein PFLUO_LOCUS5435 [Penicillium psychrofluorescens]|uniref:uncharacterized protein n=1 Tax=Penicillium psychrofluorescens TaxID=3158075 RepID=UPI003CCD366F